MPSHTDLPQLEFVEALTHMGEIADLFDQPILVLELPSVRQFSTTVSKDGFIEVAHYGLEGRYLEDIHSVEQQMADQMTHIARPDNRPITFRGFVGDAGALYVIDVEFNEESLGSESALWLCQSWCIRTAPRLSLPRQTLGQWLDRRSLVIAASGQSHIVTGHERLGVLIRHYEQGGQFFVHSN